MKTLHSTSKHLPITANTKMADVIHLNYLLLPIITRFGIELGFKNKTVKEVCEEKNIEPLFFLEIINSYHNKEYFAKDQFNNYSVTLIITYLQNTHDYYLSSKIPALEAMVDNFIESSCDKNKTNNKLVASFFKSYKEELTKHFNIEEADLFPYTQELEKAIATKQVSNKLLKKIKEKANNYSEEDHNHLEEKLYDLKNIIIKYLPPVKHKQILETLLIELFRMEDDLNEHSRIEDKVLTPKIIQLEEQVKATING